jgi:integrase
VPSPLPATCRVGYCDLWVQGDRPLCLSHGKSLLARGYTDVDAFAHDWEHQPRGHEHIDLRRLPARLRLELQYVLQCRRDEATAKVGLQMVQRVVNALATDEITSLLERTEESYQQLLAPAKVSGGVTFLVAARRRIEQLAYGRGWSVEYPRDVWRLRNLESGTSTPAATIRFDRIPQAWLRDLAKRWARWRISSGISPTSTSSKSINAIARFAMFLARPEVGVGALADVDRAVIERYLADLHNELAGRKVHRDHIGGLSAFLVAIRQHRWDDTLPSSAMIFPEDYPKSMKLMPRALAEHVMAQLEDPANLDRWDDPVARLITLILMRCGLRVSDATKLPYDCLVSDADGAPYLRYLNHKMRREALVPIDDELHALIADQQRRLLDTWPDGVAVLFPRPIRNLDGSKPFSYRTYRKKLLGWVQRCDVRDEHGQPACLTPHQWRHTLGTRLINRDVPQEVVRRLLDHDSAEMTSHYARLSDTTVRRHWERALKVNARGETVSYDPDGPMAEAVWAKQRLSRATQALPNGYCGLPVARSCPHANSCLTCPMFLTTAEFLPQHRQQHQQTLQIISAAEARGQARMMEMNRQVADNLEKIITALEADGDPGRVADAC